MLHQYFCRFFVVAALSTEKSEGFLWMNSEEAKIM